jgi:hypothetical protein
MEHLEASMYGDGDDNFAVCRMTLRTKRQRKCKKEKMIKEGNAIFW